MGMYIYVSNEDTKRMKEVHSDKNIHELLQEALTYNDTILIEENYRYRRKKGYKGWWKGEKEKYFEYQVYHESRAHDGSAYQASYQTSCGTTKQEVINYLYGIINGGLGVIAQRNEPPKED